MTFTVVVPAIAGAVGFAYAAHRSQMDRRFRSRVRWNPGNGPHRGPLVYIVRAVGTHEVKVGMTTGTVDGRVGGWESGRPEHVVLEGVILVGSKAEAFRVERAIHRALKRAKRHIGKEWFRLPIDDAPEWRPIIERAAG